MTVKTEEIILGFIYEVLPQLNKENIDLDKPLDELGMDSMDLNSLALEIEEKFNVTIDDEDLETLKTTRHFIDMINKVK